MTKAEQIREEIEALRRDGIIDAKDVVKWAQDHPESALHSQFEWDKDKAAWEHWLYQARRLIAIHVVEETGQRTVVSLSIDRPKGGGYRSIDDVLKNEDLTRAMLADALADVKRARAKYQHLSQLAPIDVAVAEIERKHMGESRKAA